MRDYFECELRLNTDDEPFVTTVILRILPRIGEHIATKINGSMHRFVIEDIWHFAGDDKTVHRINIYVRHDVRVREDI